MAEQKASDIWSFSNSGDSQEASSPNVDIPMDSSPALENGLVKDPGSLKVENE